MAGHSYVQTAVRARVKHDINFKVLEISSSTTVEAKFGRQQYQRLAMVKLGQ